jgi:hypothetical protein
MKIAMRRVCCARAAIGHAAAPPGVGPVVALTYRATVDVVRSKNRNCRKDGEFPFPAWPRRVALG